MAKPEYGVILLMAGVWAVYVYALTGAFGHPIIAAIIALISHTFTMVIGRGASPSSR